MTKLVITELLLFLSDGLKLDVFFITFQLLLQ